MFRCILLGLQKLLLHCTEILSPKYAVENTIISSFHVKGGQMKVLAESKIFVIKLNDTFFPQIMFYFN